MYNLIYHIMEYNHQYKTYSIQFNLSYNGVYFHIYWIIKCNFNNNYSCFVGRLKLLYH